MYFFRLFSLFLLAALLYNCERASEEASAVSVPGSIGSNPDGLFEDVPATSSGIDFVNTVKSDFTFNHISYGYLFNGAGVGVIDYDKDGLQDLYFVSNQDENRLYRNLGDFKFEDVTAAAGVAGQPGFDVGVSIADIDGDGFQDIYLSRSGIVNTPEGMAERENLLLHNNGDGTFSERGAEFGLNSNRPGTQATFFDYDLDGDLDMFQMNTPINFGAVNIIRAVQTPDGPRRQVGPVEPWESDQLFRNDDGVFTDVSAAAGINNRGFGLSTLIYDFNHDGYPDIFVANDYLDDDEIFINNGTGGFIEQGRGYFRHSSLNSMGSDLGDINNDGLEDIITLDMLAETQQRQKQLMSSMRPDRYGTLIRLGYSHQIMRNQLQLNNGQNFSEISEMAGIGATDWSWTPLMMDFDNDRKVDIFVSNGYRYDLTDSDFIDFTVDSVITHGGINDKTFEDFSGFLKIVPTKPQSNYLFRNQGDLQFDDVAGRWNLAEPSYSSSAVYADLDNDGDMDLVVGNHERPPFVHRNRAVELKAAGNWLQLSPRGAGKNTAGLGLTVLAVMGDEKIRQTLQPNRGFLGTNHSLLHFGLGDVATVDRLEITWPDGKTQLLTNVKVNQRLDLDYAAAGTQPFPGAAAGARFVYPQGQRGIDFVHEENGFNDFDRQFLQPRMTSREGPALAKADVNNDGREDLFIGGAAGAAAALYLQDAGGNFTRSAVFPPADNAHEDVAALFFDADGDGDQDLYVASGGSHAEAGNPVYNDRFYRNEGGKFTRGNTVLPLMPTCTGAVATIDFDADGDLDLVVGGRNLPGSYPLAPRSYLLRNDGGNFLDVTETAFPLLTNIGMVTAIATGNVTGDDLPEIIIAGEWMPVTTYAWTGSKFEADPDGPSAGTGFWQSLLLTDLDGDGRKEVVAGNDGLNTRFQPGPGNRVSLFASDFDGNGAIDPIVTFEDEQGKMVPITTKGMMIKQMPKLKKKFVRASVYSRAGIEDMFSAGELAAARRYDLETVSSSVIRLADEGWVVEALPRMAQTAPARSIRSADFNGDGLPDLLFVGNDYGLQVETGRIDAGNGVLLLNDGKGGWKTVPNHQHGFWASLDARDLLDIQLADGKTGWVITNNNGPAAIYLEE